MVEHICKRITAEERAQFKRMCAAMHEEAEFFWTQKGRVYRDGHVLSIKKGKELLEIEAQKAAAEGIVAFLTQAKARINVKQLILTLGKLIIITQLAISKQSR